jgi:predicted AAA+ superfamily ATPase
MNTTINWDNRMIALKGPRGTGKTTLMLQRLKFHASENKLPLYITMEHPHLYNRGALFETAETYYQHGGRYLFIDEVHKYEHWARELKVIYDGFPDLKVVFSASSALEIYMGEADLSRRVITYNFPGMSFREYVNVKLGLSIQPIGLTEILKNHLKISGEILKLIKPLPLFNNYLKEGYLPIIMDTDPDTYSLQLVQIINSTLNQDIHLSKKLSAAAIAKLKQILGIIAQSVPFEPNISSISQKTNIGRDTIYDFLTYLEEAKILSSVKKIPKGIAGLQKPKKIYLENPNFNYALQTNPDVGTVRETFFLNQLRNAGHEVNLPNSKYDFLVDNSRVFEVGGKNKTVSDENVFVAADGMEVGWANTIPLWIFGFLY